MSPTKSPDILCFSHLRWDFVFQRPQHLMTRFAARGRVFYIEEPVATQNSPHLAVRKSQDGIRVVVPHLRGQDGGNQNEDLRTLLNRFLEEEGVSSFCAWYYTPMALAWSDHLQPLVTIYDCMDELSAFKGAAPSLQQMEEELLQRADIVFTGGQSLYEAKRHRHHNAYCFPSSVDVPHFAQARAMQTDPEDQAHIAHPRVGYCGVIDERIDVDLIRAVAAQRPEWQLVMIGPTAKIEPSELPRASNIHYLGLKRFQELPSYLSGWDAAILPFARNESTRFISPTKTPEYLAAGRPVISTSIRDVVCPYGDLGLVHIADSPEEFVAAIEKAFSEGAEGRLKKVDELLSVTSWSRTWGRMAELVQDASRRGITMPSAPLPISPPATEKIGPAAAY